jgi:hypothetical protein
VHSTLIIAGVAAIVDRIARKSSSMGVLWPHGQHGVRDHTVSQRRSKSPPPDSVPMYTRVRTA